MNRPFLGLACLALLLAMVQRCDTGNPVDPDSNGNPPAGTRIGSIRGTVMVGGSPISAVVSLTGVGITRTGRTSGLDGRFIFADLPPGNYSLTASHPGFACEPATADVRAGQTATASIACTQPAPGTIAGIVKAGGSPIPGVAVRVTGAFTPGGLAITDADGAFTFTVPSGGPYTVTAFAEGTTCEWARSVMVEEDQTSTVNIVCEPIGGITGVVRWANGSPIPFLSQVTLNGPVGRREVQASGQGGFGFGDLPPGDYTVTATVAGCHPVTAAIQVAHVTSVEIVCDLPDFRQIAGDFFFYLPRESDEGFPTYSQMGTCPPPLPWERTRRSLTFDAASGRVSMVRLDPDLTIVGALQAADCQQPGCQEKTRVFSGTGSAVRADGSSIRSDLTGTFEFSTFDRGHYYFSGSMTRVHRDPAGELVCTETYQVEGNDIQ